ncbi:MAG: MoaD family protein [Chloroflexi bacterium]|nr:MoaD family protein [Chloroflexota bacterium]
MTCKTIHLFATLRDLTSAKQIEVPFRDGQTVRELIQSVSQISPALADKMVNERGELTGLVHVLVDGRNVEWLDGLDTTIRESDMLVFLPPAAGG